MRYSFNMYKGVVIRELEKHIGKENVKEMVVTKNNDQKVEGVQLYIPGQASPIIYFQNYTDCYDDTDVKEFVQRAVDTYNNAKHMKRVSIQDVYDWNKMKNYVVPKICNFERNQERIKEKVYVRVLDFAVTFSIRTTELMEQLGDGRIAVNESMLEIWGITVEELYNQAMQNLNDSKYQINSLGEMLGVEDLNSAAPTLYLITTFKGNAGAAVLLSSVILQKACEKLESKKIYILPSSVSEVLVLDAEDPDVVVNELQKMVREINEAIVSPEEYLSDNVYVFENGTISIAENACGEE